MLELDFRATTYPHHLLLETKTVRNGRFRYWLPKDLPLGMMLLW
jgi:hypothetical protein